MPANSRAYEGDTRTQAKSRGGPRAQRSWRGVVTAATVPRGPVRGTRNLTVKGRGTARAVTSSRPSHPLPPSALPTTATRILIYYLLDIIILFTLPAQVGVFLRRPGLQRTKKQRGKARHVRIKKKYCPRLNLCTSLKFYPYLQFEKKTFSDHKYKNEILLKEKSNRCKDISTFCDDFSADRDSCA